MRVLICAGAFILLPGCVSVVKTVVTAPIKVVSKTADVMTTSQSEADEKRGREMRKREESVGKLARQREKAQVRCDDGNQQACVSAADMDGKIAALRDKSI